ncbi:hypothetical protein SLUN_01575 [Streptomyces lunaelactis]|uniref:Uncharacterized protein n=1 Tax=Streptomyces lunaelactis TaxID=1535768 RepID=A0A2R4SWA7_9ACTN|nr:hypothetical protein [Streptomyces lunaelactis]AVZ71134.1 hypothetical protein SLUN_01575 [Streptomyces lunaelactis]
MTFMSVSVPKNDSHTSGSASWCSSPLTGRGVGRASLRNVTSMSAPASWSGHLRMTESATSPAVRSRGTMSARRTALSPETLPPGTATQSSVPSDSLMV